MVKRLLINTVEEQRLFVKFVSSRSVALFSVRAYPSFDILTYHQQEFPTIHISLIFQ